MRESPTCRRENKATQYCGAFKTGTQAHTELLLPGFCFLPIPHWMKAPPLGEKEKDAKRERERERRLRSPDTFKTSKVFRYKLGRQGEFFW